MAVGIGWRKIVGGVPMIQILIKELLEELLQNVFGEEIRGGGSGALVRFARFS